MSSSGPWPRRRSSPGTASTRPSGTASPTPPTAWAEAAAARDLGDRAVVELANGSALAADLVIGADGVGSVVRRALLPGGEHLPAYAGYAAWRGLLPEADLPEGAARVLLERFAFFHLPRSQALGYLVAGPDGATEPGRRRYNWVWYRPVAPGGALEAALTDSAGRRHAFSLPPGGMPAAARDALLADAERLLPPAFADAVRAEPRPFAQAVFDAEAPAMARGRIALLGDAAFVVRPHTAMGVAKAAGDALALRDRLARSDGVGEALAAYDAERRPVGRAIAAHGRRLGAPLG